MRSMTMDEQIKLLNAISKALWAISMENMDDICYGSIKSCEESGKELRAIERVVQAIPKDILNEFNAELRKREADKLRQRTDEIERGKVK